MPILKTQNTLRCSRVTVEHSMTYMLQQQKNTGSTESSIKLMISLINYYS